MVVMLTFLDYKIYAKEKNISSVLFITCTKKIIHMLGTKGKGTDKLGTKMQKSFLIYVFPNTDNSVQTTKSHGILNLYTEAVFFTNTKSAVKNNSRA